MLQIRNEPKGPGQTLGRILVGVGSAALQDLDGPDAYPRMLGQLFLSQAGFNAVVAEQRAELFRLLPSKHPYPLPVVDLLSLGEANLHPVRSARLLPSPSGWSMIARASFPSRGKR